MRYGKKNRQILVVVSQKRRNTGL